MLSLISFVPAAKSYAAPNLDLDTIPDSYLFKISNMKPGDYATRTLTILNPGKRSFTYQSRAEFTGGTENADEDLKDGVDLYNEFLLKVWSLDKDDNSKAELLYGGKLKDFEGLDPRYLPSNSAEDLRFRVDFPYELGNEYQGLAFNFELLFGVEARDPDPDPDPENPDDPETEDPDPEDPDDPETEDPGPENPDDPETEDPDDPETEGPDPEDPGDPDPEDPETEEPDPENPDDPETEEPGPENPDDPETEGPDPEDPDSTSDENEEDEINPVRPIDEDDLNSPPSDGQILPDTSTDLFNYLLAGVVFTATGLTLFMFQRRMKRDVRLKRTRLMRP
ncbi:hypothetical protein [Bacillus fonticola]|uniref:hypothetical protein n=1 Tax=Bacillus fonticola TaxID=2728853 RepID=UPI001D13B375|nr:hypothetical protein [Bacillus fonticola]